MGASWAHTGRSFDRLYPQVVRVPQPYSYRYARTGESESDVVARWAKAVAAAVDAQSATIGGGSGEAFREATSELRAATGLLVNAAVAALGGEGGTKRDQVASAVRALSAGNGLTGGASAGAVKQYRLLGMYQGCSAKWP